MKVSFKVLIKVIMQVNCAGQMQVLENVMMEVANMCNWGSNKLFNFQPIFYQSVMNNNKYLNFFLLFKYLYLHIQTQPLKVYLESFHCKYSRIVGSSKF